MSDVVRRSTKDLKKIYSDFVGESASNPEVWCKLTGKIDEYLFSWGEIPGNDYGRFIEFLIQKFDIDWVKTAKIEKIDDDKTIKISAEKNSLSLRLNNEKTKANLKINDDRTDEFIAKMENGKLNIYDVNEAEVKYYKERIILRVKAEFNTKDLNKLFKKAKSKRKILLNNDMVSLTNIQDKLSKLCIDDIGRKCIQTVYQYPLIEIEREYKLKDFDLEDEAITTFFYEIPDVGDINRFLIFPVKYKKVLMRVSGPSVVTTKMSDIMRAKLINMLYESALYKMRESERENGYRKECKKIFGSNYEYLRKYIAEIFFSIESGSSGIESGSSFQILSFISAFGALAAILGISYAVFNILPFSLEILKTGLSILLFSLTIFMLVSIVGIEYLKQKIVDKIDRYK